MEREEREREGKEGRRRKEGREGGKKEGKKEGRREGGKDAFTCYPQNVLPKYFSQQTGRQVREEVEWEGR